ncbi:hypothetical protein AM1_B0288 (plasmid) [Acaryochloris marina MBIC11017]|uniref:Uncharacterized protein n=1 Tax=Acaryochloris marina (strain MBIC 11017) TaxID=329726 RepID=A8ZLI0_ACAM1|nr:hypothetical protein AM1_B0288 [Acaryochloris marina MBIC11017]
MARADVDVIANSPSDINVVLIIFYVADELHRKGRQNGP